jgi:hypothetical protein
LKTYKKNKYTDFSLTNFLEGGLDVNQPSQKMQENFLDVCFAYFFSVFATKVVFFTYLLHHFKVSFRDFRLQKSFTTNNMLNLPFAPKIRENERKKKQKLPCQNLVKIKRDFFRFHLQEKKNILNNILC